MKISKIFWKTWQFHAGECDSKMWVFELRIKHFVSCKLPDKQCESQSICALWNMSVCTLFQVHKCDKVNLFGRFCSLVDEKCWKFHVFSLRFLYVASQILKNVIAIFVAPVSSPYLQDMLWNTKVSHNSTNRNIPEIKLWKKVQSLKEVSVCFNSFLFY